MKILVAGGAGFIGSVLCPMLRERGHEVVAVDAGWFGVGPDVLKKNLEDLSLDFLSGFHRVIFLAGLSNDPMAEFAPWLNFVYNSALPGYLAYGCSISGVGRFVYASTCSVYGFTKDNQPLLETKEARSNYPYGVSKYFGESNCLSRATEKFSVVALRQATVCGHSPRMRFDLVINKMVKDALQTKIITVNNPAIRRPVIDIRDTCLAFCLAAEAPRINGIYNIIGGNYTIAEIAIQVQSALAARGVEAEIVTNNQAEMRNYVADGSAAKRDLGFSPSFSIQQTVWSILGNLGRYGDLNNKNYHNIAVLRELATQGSLNVR